MKSELNGEMEQRVGADRVLDAARRAAPAGRAPRPLRSGPAVRVRGRGRAALPRLDLLPRDPRALPAATPAGWPSGSSRSSRRGARCTTPRPTPAASLLGTVSGGRRALRRRRRRSATRIVTLASLTLTPLRLERITGLDPGLAAGRGRRHRLRLRPRALGAGARRPAARRPCSRSTTSTPPPPTPATSRREAGTVCVLGAGHAGKLAMAAAREAMDGGTRDRRGRRRRRRSSWSPRLGLCDIGVAADLRDPLAALEALRRAGAAAGRPDGLGRQRPRLRADGDHAHRRRRDGALLLDGDQLLDRRAGRRRASPRTRG